MLVEALTIITRSGHIEGHKPVSLRTLIVLALTYCDVAVHPFSLVTDVEVEDVDVKIEIISTIFKRIQWWGVRGTAPHKFLAGYFLFFRSYQLTFPYLYAC